MTFESDDTATTTEITITRDANGNRSVSSPTVSDPESFLKSLQSEFVLLDQSTFEQFINDKSLDRGRTFSRLLGLSKYSSYRMALQKLAHAGNLSTDLQIEKLTANESNWKQQLQSLVGSLRQTFDQLTGTPYSGSFESSVFSSGIIAALKQIPTARPYCEVNELSEIEFAKIEAAISDAEKSTERDKLAKHRDDLLNLESLKPGETEQEEQKQLEKAIEDRESALAQTAGPLLLKNYRAAVDVMNDESWVDDKKCPTCETLTGSSLLESLNQKLTAFETAEAERAKAKELWSESSWVIRWQKIERNPIVNPDGQYSRFDEFRAAFEDGTATKQQLLDAQEVVDSIDKRRQNSLDSLKSEIKKLESSLPESMVAVTKQITAAKAAAEDLKKYNELKPKFDRVTQQLFRRKAWTSFISEAHRNFSQAESSLVNSRQQAISNRYTDIHDAITRNQDVVPLLDRPENSERLHLRLSQFYGLTDVSANTLLQESYCNSIAISIFLSTAMQCPGTARFIILDDITSSFDGGHQFNLMELLRNQISPGVNQDGLQVILLTHDTLLEKYLDRASQTGTWRHQKLIGCPPNGPVLNEQHNANHVRQRAVNFLQAGQTDAAKPWIRQYLESVLSQIIRKVSIRVPVDYAMDDNKKMVQNALDAIKTEISLHQSAGNLILEPQQIQDVSVTLVPSLIGNFCAHYNTGTFAGITAHVLLGVLNDVDKLADCFKYDCICQQSGQTVRRFYKDLTRKNCNC